MRKSYFAPMCVLAVLLLLCGLTGFVLSSVLTDSLAAQAAALSDTHSSSSDQKLYAEASALRKELSFQKTDKFFFTSATSVTLGLLLLWWAFDRRRLLKRLNDRAEGVAQDSHNKAVNSDSAQSGVLPEGGGEEQDNQ